MAATMFGVTTPCVTAVRAQLEAHGYEVLVFHATGVGGRSMESLVRDRFLAGVLDITTTELADEVAGGTLSAGPDRLEAAGQAGIDRAELLRYLEEAAEVLDLMNQEYGLQHLDIKPRNLFLVGRHVKVADFGLVSSLTELQGGEGGGLPHAAITPLYAAPEVFL